MKVSYKFSNILGAVYYKGNVLFAPNGDTVFSPTGNRLSFYDLKRSVCQTLPLESKHNITAVAISPNERFLIIANEIGEVTLVATFSMTVIHCHRLHRPVNCVRFSPDGKFFALTKENSVFVYFTPGKINCMYNPFVMYRALQSFYDHTTTLCWSSDSRYLAVGSRDMCTRVFRLSRADARCDCVLACHNSPIEAVFLVDKSMDCYTLSSSGELCCWTCSLPPEDEVDPPKPKSSESTSDLDPHKEMTTDVEMSPVDKTAGGVDTQSRANDSEGGVGTKSRADDSEGAVDTQSRADSEGGVDTKSRANDSEGAVDTQSRAPIVMYSRRLKRLLLDLVREGGGGDSAGAGAGGHLQLTAADYHQTSRILVTAYSYGSFMLHEMPDLLHIHSLSVSDQRVASVCWSGDGDWLALACGGRGQLLVWEWRSESYVFKQQGHANDMVCVAYSPNADTIVTGGHDGKVKLWHASRCYCFVTFSEHKASVTEVLFVQSGRAVLSASLDGTVRAFDTGRYRNFRTLTSPRVAQFSCMSVDSSGELVAAGSQDLFEIYLWSLKHGKLLEILSGHEAPVSGVCFTPSVGGSHLASTSWDKTVRIWDVMSSKVQRETFELHSEGLAVQYRPDGAQLAVTTLSGQIQLLDPALAAQTGTIEGRSDMGSGRADTDQITAKKKLQAKAFTTLAYTADGRGLIAAGSSKHICFYHVQEAMLMAKFEVSQNRSLDAVDDYIHRRKMSDFGNLALVQRRQLQEGDGGERDVHLRLPGVKYGDMAARAMKREVRVLSVKFSPAGDSFCAVTTEGLLLYSLPSASAFSSSSFSQQQQQQQFAPFCLSQSVTRQSVLAEVRAKQHVPALTMALQLSLDDVTRHVIEHVPVSEVDSVVAALPLRYVLRLLVFISGELSSSRHLQFYVLWTHSLLVHHSGQLRSGSCSSAVLPHVKRLQRALTTSHASLRSLCDNNRYSLDYLCKLSQLQSASSDADQPQQKEQQETDSSSPLPDH